MRYDATGDQGRNGANNRSLTEGYIWTRPESDNAEVRKDDHRSWRKFGNNVR
jgi:hypothetical protein